MKLSRLTDGLTVKERCGAGDPEISAVVYDARQVREGSLFCTWKGLKTDGHAHVPEALQRGASALIVEQALPATSGCPWLQVDSGRRALATLAANFYGHPAKALDMIGITGTNGKTSSAYLLQYFLERSGTKSGLLGTVEYRAGRERIPSARTTPESADLQQILARMLEAGCGAAVMEVSSHALELERVHNIPFRAAIFTNLTRDHLDFHGTMEQYLAAKMRLFRGLAPGALAVLNADDPATDKIRECLADGVRMVTFGFSTAADYRVEDLQCRADGSEFILIGPSGRRRMWIPWVGKFNVCNAMGVLAMLLARGADINVLAEGLAAAPSVPGRMQVVPHEGDFAVLVDYAHTDDAVSNVLHSLRPLCRGNLKVLIGCGGDRDRSKRPLMAHAACTLADGVVFTSDNPRSENPETILSEMTAAVADKQNYYVIADRRQAIKSILSNAAAGDVIVLAGKGHEATQEVAGVCTRFSDVEVAQELLHGGGR